MDFLASTAAPLIDDKGVMGAGNGPFCKWWQFSVAMALSGAAGIRATLPVFLLSLLHQMEPDQFPLSDQVHWLRRQEICVLLGVVLLIEILADQIPALDHALHAILAPVHPLMGAAAAVAPDYCGGMYTRVPMALLGGSLASTVHAGKALARAGSSGASFGVLNPVLSHCENLSGVALVVLSLISPVFALGASLLFIYIGYLGFKWTKRAMNLGDDPASASQDEEAGCAEKRRPFVATAPPLDNRPDYYSRVPQRPVADAPQAGAPQRPVADALQAGDGSSQAEAQREVDRVLAAPNLHWVLGGGSSAETKQEYRRLLRLVHPDRGHCSGERATMALRRVVEAHNVLHASA